MVTKQTMQMKRFAELQNLIRVLTPFAAKYKAPRMAKAALEASGWSIGTGMGGSTRFSKYIGTNQNAGQGREWFEIYEYGKKCDSLPEMMIMLNSQLFRYRDNAEASPTCYDTGLRSFINDNLGTGKDLTLAQFQAAKQEVLNRLSKAMEYVAAMSDCQNVSYDEFGQ